MPVVPAKVDKVYALADCIGRSLFRLISAVLVARLCGAGTYAVYVLCIAIETVAMAVSNACNLAPMLSIGPGLPDCYRENFLSRVARKHARWSCWAAVVAVLSAMLLVAEAQSDATWAAFGLAMLATGVLNGARSRQQARFQSRQVFWADCLAMSFPLLMVSLFYPAAPDTLLVVYFLALAMGAGLAVMSMDRARPASIQVAVEVPVEVLARCARMGPPMAIGSIANSACSRVQPFVLQGAAGGMAVGQFGVAATAMGPVRMLAMALSSIVRPRLALQLGRGELRAANRMLLHVCMLIASCGAAAVIAALLLGEWLVVTVFGAEFAAVGRLLPLAFVFAALEATAAILVVALQTLRGDGAATATRLRTIVSVLALLVVWPACHLASVAGAMTALCATELVFLALAHEALRRPQVGLDGR